VSFSCAVVAWGAQSPLGEGEAAFEAFALGERAPVRVRRDEELVRAGLLRPYCARASLEEGPRDRATVLVERALAQCARELDAGLPSWRARRVGLAVGTSSGGMRAFEGGGARFEGSYLGPVLDAERPCAFEPFTLVLGACASSTIAIGLARQWLASGACDIAIAGGFDAVSVFVAAGFESLRATCSERGPRPFRRDRDGLALGEGSAFLAMVRPDDAAAPCARAWVAGFGASCDAVHLTAPDRTGAGLARAAKAAAAGAHVDLVSAHGTATVFNDAAEALALREVSAAFAVVHALKGTVGHTLGAAGALEALSAIQAMRRGIAPASQGEGPVDGDLRVLDTSEPGDLRATLKLAAAFGGANAALLLLRDRDGGSALPGEPSAVVEPAVHVSRAAALTSDLDARTDPAVLARKTGYPEDRLARADRLSRLTLAAVGELAELVGGPDALRGAGIVVGHGLATIETNALFLARIAASGAARAEPRRFPFTTPNAGAGESAVAFGLTGPAFAVGGGPHGGIEALAVAADLVRAKTVDRVVVVAVDDAGPATWAVDPGAASGAVALLVSAAPSAGRLLDAGVRLPEALDSASLLGLSPLSAHTALVPLAGEDPASSLEIALPRGGFAKARVLWL
jgi:3-oxoacyl-[acyl-carrier-protein] synthase II